MIPSWVRKAAPPLIVPKVVDKRGTVLREINPAALAYARQARVPLDAIYPGGTAKVRALGPAAGEDGAAAFARATGLEPQGATFGADVRHGWRWAWAAVAGALAGALVGGPVGLAVGGIALGVAARKAGW